jgi:hypothetical protein
MFTVFKGNAPKSTGGSLRGVGPGNAMTPDKEPVQPRISQRNPLDASRMPHQL